MSSQISPLTKGRGSQQHHIDTDYSRTNLKLKQVKQNEIETLEATSSKMPPYQSDLHDTIDEHTIDIDNNIDDRPHVLLMCNPQEEVEPINHEEQQKGSTATTTKEAAHHIAAHAHNHQAATKPHPHPHRDIHNHQRTNIPEGMFHLEEANTASTDVESYCGASSGSELDDSTIDSLSTSNEEQQPTEKPSTTLASTTGLRFEDEEEEGEEVRTVAQAQVEGEDRESENTRVGARRSFKQQRRTSGSAFVGISELVQEELEDEVGKQEQQVQRRRVTFAGQVIRCKDDSRRIKEVLDAVTVIEIPHVSEYTKKEKRSLWYTREEMTQMKALCIETVRRAISKHNYNKTMSVCADQETLYCRFFFLRGLERFVDYYQIVNNDTSSTSTTTNSDSGGGSGRGGQASQSSQSQSKQRDDGGITSVLQEQYNQRLQCLQMHRVVYGGILDPERLRNVYEKQGKTTESLQEAQELAKQDEIHVNEYCIIDDESNEFDLTLVDDSYTSSSHHYDDVEYFDYNDVNDPDDDDDHHHRNNNKNHKKKGSNKIQEIMVIKPTMILDVLGVNKILRRFIHPLISPIVDERHGDIFLKIENTECFS